MKIITHPFFLAPIAEVTTPAFRRAVRLYSKDVIICSEMLSAPSVVRGGVHNESLISKYEFDDPFVYQIMGSDPETMAQASKLLAKSNPYGIDINMGCSAPDIVKRGCGSVLLTDFDLVKKIVRACRAVIETRFSIKLRTGYTCTDEKYLIKITKMLQDEGVDYITLHGRHGKMAFKRSADWSLVAKLKKELRMPVIGNGDVVTAQMAVDRIKETKCDGVMIARRAITEPWIFRLAASIYNNETDEFEVDLQDLSFKVLDDIEKILPEQLHKSRAHRYLFYFVKNVNFGHQLFTRIRHVDDIKSMKEYIQQYFERSLHERVRVFSTT